MCHAQYGLGQATRTQRGGAMTQTCALVAASLVVLLATVAGKNTGITFGALDSYNIYIKVYTPFYSEQLT